jgi:hypothetical protein
MRSLLDVRAEGRCVSFLGWDDMEAFAAVSRLAALLEDVNTPSNWSEAEATFQRLSAVPLLSETAALLGVTA